MRTFLFVFLAITSVVAEDKSKSFHDNIEKFKELLPFTNDILNADVSKVLATVLSKYQPTSEELTDVKGGNLIYAVAVKMIKNILANLNDEMSIAKIGKPDGLLYVENGLIKGLGNIQFEMDYDGANINNLTVGVPSLSITAEHYIINNLNLGVAIISGEGQLEIDINNFDFRTSMDAKVMGLKGITVTKVHGLWLNLDSSMFSLTNLGESGDELSTLLNSIASDILPVIINGLSNDLNEVFEDYESLFRELFTYVINTILCVAKGNDISECPEE